MTRGVLETGDGRGGDAPSVLVTGAAGFLGSHLCEALVDAGWSVWGLDNFHPHYNPAAKHRNLEAVRDHPAMHLVQGDIRDTVLLEGLMSGRSFYAVVHLAALPGVRTSLEAPDRCIEINVNGTLAVLEATTRHGVSNFVFASSSSVYGESEERPFHESDAADRPISPYAASKRAGEMLCHAYHRTFGVSVHCLRIFSAFGPRQRPDLAIHTFVRLMRNGNPVTLFGDGSSERDYTHVDDVVDGIVQSLRRLAGRAGEEPEYEIVNLGRGETIRLDRLVRTLAAVLDVEPGVECLPDHPGDVPVTHACIDKAGELLGWAPRRSIEEGLDAFVRWYDEVHEPRRDRHTQRLTGTNSQKQFQRAAKASEPNPSIDPEPVGGAG